MSMGFVFFFFLKLLRGMRKTHFSFRAWVMSSSEVNMELVPSGRTSPVERPNMLSRSAAKLWAIELGGIGQPGALPLQGSVAYDSGRGGLPPDMIAVGDVGRQLVD